MLCRNCGCSEYEHEAGQICPRGGGMFDSPFNNNNWIVTCPGCVGNEQRLHWKNCVNNPKNHLKAGTKQDSGISGITFNTQSQQVNPKFHAALRKMAEIHDKKSQDYAHDGNRYSNFEEAAATAGVSVDDVFAVLIGIKLARLRELLKSGKTPNNESVQDSRSDLAVYATLWLSYHEG